MSTERDAAENVARAALSAFFDSTGFSDMRSTRLRRSVVSAVEKALRDQPSELARRWRDPAYEASFRARWGR